MKKPLIILIPVLSFLCCTLKEKSSYTLKIKNSKGELNVLSYKITGKDSVLDGLSKFYSLNGKIKDEIYFRNSLKNGWHMHFDTLGNLQQKTFYINGLIEGNSFSYDLKGNVITESYYIKDRQVFAKGYYVGLSSKPVIKLYNIFDEHGNVQYVVLFDTTGKKIYENGFIFDTTVHFKPSKDSLKLNNTTEMTIFTTNLPNYSRTIKFYYFVDNKKINLNYQILDSGYYLTVKFSPPQINNGLIFLTGELKDEFGKLVKRDTLNRIVKVIQ